MIDSHRLAILDRVDELLSAYSAKDAERLLQLISPEEIAVYGTDYAEACFTHEAVVRQLELDFHLWDSVRFDEPQHISIQVSSSLATAFFDVAFYSVIDGHEQQFNCRFATVWINRADVWYLVQSLNTVLTVGHSAADMLGVNLELLESSYE